MGYKADVVYGRLTVIGEPYAYSGRHMKALCRCACGTEKEVRVHHLKTGAIQSCGCQKREAATTHGMSGSYTYSSWEQMISRCFNPGNRAFKNYGGRGITVCARWRGERGFENFLADMGERPFGMTIERKKNSAGYSPGNCRWATRLEQNRNSRKNRPVTFRGKTLCVSEWAVIVGIGKKTIEGRLNRDWTPEKALTVRPIRTREYPKRKR